MDIIGRMTKLLEKIKKKGWYGDILYEEIEKVEYHREGNDKEINPLSLKSAFHIRCIHKGKKVEMKMGDIRDADGIVSYIEKLFSVSPRIRKLGVYKFLGPKKKEYRRTPRIDPRKENLKVVFKNMEKSITEAKKEAIARTGVKGVRIITNVWFFSQNEVKYIMDTEGFYRRQTLPRTFLQVEIKAKKGNKLARTRVRLGDIKGLDVIFSPQLMLNKESRDKIRNWMEKAIKLLDAETLSQDELNDITHFILDRHAIGVFVHEALGHNFEADIVKKGGSGIIKKSGKSRGRVGIPGIHIIDGPLLKRDGKTRKGYGFGTEFIDDEGVEVKIKYLALRGEVNEMILNRETAYYYDKIPNGGAFSELGDERVCRMSNTYLFPADPRSWYKTLDELIKGVKKGIILEGTLGGQVMKDGMTSSIQIGYLVENGSITKVIKPGNFSAKSMMALRYVDAFAGDVDIDDLGFCGKAGQSKPVSDGGPEWTRIKNNKYVKLIVQR